MFVSVLQTHSPYATALLPTQQWGPVSSPAPGLRRGLLPYGDSTEMLQHRTVPRQELCAVLLCLRTAAQHCIAARLRGKKKAQPAAAVASPGRFLGASALPAQSYWQWAALQPASPTEDARSHGCMCCTDENPPKWDSSPLQKQKCSSIPALSGWVPSFASRMLAEHPVLLFTPNQVQ